MTDRLMPFYLYGFWAVSVEICEGKDSGAQSDKIWPLSSDLLRDLGG